MCNFVYNNSTVHNKLYSLTSKLLVYFFSFFLPSRLEVRAILKGAVIRVINLSYYDVSLAVILCIVFSVYVSIDESNVLTPKRVFTTLSLLSFVRLVSLHFMIASFIQISEGRVALKRITVSCILNSCSVMQSLSPFLSLPPFLPFSLPFFSLRLSLSLSLHRIFY